jgi:hypothetical protein
MWCASGRNVPNGSGYLILMIGIGAFFIHFGHYFQLKITKWIFGDKDYFKARPQ